MPQHPEHLVKGKKRPFTGAEYLESLRDGREVYIYGERVKDVTKHPAFRNAAVSVAKLYDALHDRQDQGRPDDGHRHRLRRLHAPLLQGRPLARGGDRQRDAIAAWARITYGWMGRSPDYKAAFLNTLGANAEFYGKFADNARAWHVRGAGGRALRQPRARQSAHRPLQAGRAGEGRLHLHPEGDGRRHLRLRAPRWWPPTRRSRTTTSSARTWARTSTIRAWW